MPFCETAVRDMWVWGLPTSSKPYFSLVAYLGLDFGLRDF